jgi:bacillithiol synthase
MAISNFNRNETGFFTDIGNRIANKQNTLLPYIEAPFSAVAFQEQIIKKSAHFTKEKRSALRQHLRKQYQTISAGEKVNTNIESLAQENTFTITTGHQLSIFTGPIYLVYKILHAIRLAEELSKTYPNQHFVPVFWMASEDHDFEEIQSVSLFNRSFKWETAQKGPVGRFNMDSFEVIHQECKELFSNDPNSEVHEVLNTYKGSTLKEATFHLIDALFGKYGLVVVDGDSPILKREFSTVMEKELMHQFSFQAVSTTNEALKKENIKLQVTPREVNLFYIENQLRSRIIPQKKGFLIEGKGKYTQAEILEELKSNPASFSPNVVLRPLYQESVLPNLCYLGGGGEMTYWLQLKGAFEAVNCQFPLVQVRNSLLLVDSTSIRKMEKLGLTIQDIFLDLETMRKKFFQSRETETSNFDKMDRAFSHLKKELLDHANILHPSYSSFTEAEIKHLEKKILHIKTKFLKFEKEKYRLSLTQLEHLKNKLFPAGQLQERSINFFSLCADGKVFSHLQTLYHAIQPFGNDLIVIH